MGGGEVIHPLSRGEEHCRRQSEGEKSEEIVILTEYHLASVHKNPAQSGGPKGVRNKTEDRGEEQEKRSPTPSQHHEFPHEKPRHEQTLEGPDSAAPLVDLDDSSVGHERRSRQFEIQPDG